MELLVIWDALTLMWRFGSKICLSGLGNVHVASRPQTMKSCQNQMSNLHGSLKLNDKTIDTSSRKVIETIYKINFDDCSVMVYLLSYGVSWNIRSQNRAIIGSGNYLVIDRHRPIMLTNAAFYAYVIFSPIRGLAIFETNADLPIDHGEAIRKAMHK